MSLSNFISEKLFLHFSDMLTGYSIYNSYKFLDKSQYWSRDALDDYQNAKLRDLIKHAYSNVPFYRDLFLDLGLKPEDIQSKDDLLKIPIITKEDLRKKKKEHLATNINRKNLLYRSSSGSTGEPFQFYVSKYSESMQTAAAIRAWYWMGYSLGDKYVKVSMNPRSSIIKKLQDRINNSLYLSSTQLTPESFSKIADQVKRFDPKIIRCYPVPLFVLAKEIERLQGQYSGKSLVAINTTGSTLHPDTRAFIEQIFKTRIFDSYSCEGGAVFSQCTESGLYHPAEEYAISEFLTDEFTHSAPDKPLRHITTDLHNYASPFIRYDTQDYLILGSEQLCRCGRHFLNIDKIKGRDSDILITPSGQYLIVENFVAYFEWIPEVDQIQVVQDKIDEIVIKLIVNESFTSEVKMKISNYWADYIGSDVNVIVEVVDEIKLTPTGKRRTVIRNSNLSLHG